MNDCDSQLLNAYHDGELAPSERATVEAHLAACEACRTELAMIRRASRLLADHPFPELSSEQLDALHDAVDAGADRPVLRMFGILSTVAASLLIVSCAWLSELSPKSPTPGGGAVVHQSWAAPEPWEQVAMTLQPFPIDRAVGDSVQFADASLADWMLDGISRSERHEQKTD